MKTRTKLKFCKSLKSVALLMSGAVVLLAASEAPRRIKSNIVDAETAEIQGHIRPATAIAQDLGPVDGSQVLSHLAIHFAPTAAQKADLAQFLAQVQDKNSKSYHKFLTPEEFGARFGMNSADLAKVQLWLEQKGFSNFEIARGKNYISFSGTAAQAEAAFGTPLHRYQLNGQTLFANTANPRIPKALNGMVESIRGLQSPQAHPHIRFRPRYNSGSSGAHYLTPDDWATIYDVQALYKAGYDGTGVKIVVVGQSDINTGDITAFRTAAGLTTTNLPTIIHAGTQPGIINGDESESDLDIEWAGGVAKNATIVFVVGNPNSGNGVDDAITYAVNNNLGQVLTTSYGACETSLSASQLATQNSQFAQANAQGMTVLAASGDAGAADCDTSYPAQKGLAVDFPASSPYVLGVGGTTLTDTGSNWNGSNNSNGGSAGGYIPEKAWNNTSASVGLSATGGGMSVKFTKPAWQTGTGVPVDGQRDVPDLAAAADPSHVGLLICSSDPTTVAGACSNNTFADSSQNLNVTGGTSAAAPSMAGVVALLVQKTGGSQGNISANLYSLAASTPAVFHDVTPGNNIVPCQSGSTGCPGSLQYGYSAGTGYDQTTGLGTLDANNLFGAWADYGLSFNPTTLTITAANSGTSTLTVTSLNGFSGTVTFTCSVASTLVAVSCTAPTSVTVNSTTTSQTTTLTINAGSTAHTLPWRFVPPAGPWRMLMLAAALLSLGMSLLLLKQRRVNLFAGALACFLLLGLASCGGSSSSTPATNESGNVTVTASSGSFAKSISVAVNIN